MSIFRPLLLLVLSVVLVAGCGNVPQPFKDTAKTRLTALPTPQPSAGLVLLPIDVLGPANGDISALHAQIIRRLHSLEIAATALDIRNRYRMAGTVQTLRGDADKTRLIFTWRLLTARGSELSFTQHGVPVSSEKWQAGNQLLLERVATEAAYKIRDLVNGDPIADGDQDAGQSRPLLVSMAPVADSNGGALELMIAMRRALRRNQVDVVDTAPGIPVVSVSTSLTRITGAEDLVVIVWTVRDADGRQRGQMKQQNRVPAGKLKFRWGTTAVLAANGAVGDLIDLLKRLRAADKAKNETKNRTK